MFREFGVVLVRWIPEGGCVVVQPCLEGRFGDTDVDLGASSGLYGSLVYHLSGVAITVQRAVVLVSAVAFLFFWRFEDLCVVALDDGVDVW